MIRQRWAAIHPGPSGDPALGEMLEEVVSKTELSSSTSTVLSLSVVQTLNSPGVETKGKWWLSNGLF